MLFMERNRGGRVPGEWVYDRQVSTFHRFWGMVAAPSCPETWTWVDCAYVRAQSCPTLCDSMGCTHQTPLSLQFFIQESWSGLPFSVP